MDQDFLIISDKGYAHILYLATSRFDWYIEDILKFIFWMPVQNVNFLIQVSRETSYRNEDQL